MKEEKANYVRLYRDKGGVDRLYTGYGPDVFILILGHNDFPSALHIIQCNMSGKMKYYDMFKSRSEIYKCISKAHEIEINDFKYLDNIKKFCYFGLSHIESDDIQYELREGLAIVTNILYNGVISNDDAELLNKYYRVLAK